MVAVPVFCDPDNQRREVEQLKAEIARLRAERAALAQEIGTWRITLAQYVEFQGHACDRNDLDHDDDCGKCVLDRGVVYVLARMLECADAAKGS